MKLDSDLKKKPFSCSHSVDFFHAVKNSQSQLRCPLNMVFTAGISFGNISGSDQNVIFKIMGTFYIFFLFAEIIRNTVQKRHTGNPNSLCLKYIQKAFADNHGRHNKGSIFRINIHFCCKHLIRLINSILITRGKF